MYKHSSLYRAGIKSMMKCSEKFHSKVTLIMRTFFYHKCVHNVARTRERGKCKGKSVNKSFILQTIFDQMIYCYSKSNGTCFSYSNVP
jgi:hypothetical protein